MKKNACHAATSALSIHGPRVIGFDQHRQLHAWYDVSKWNLTWLGEHSFGWNFHCFPRRLLRNR